jgi:hypothetical protein
MQLGKGLIDSLRQREGQPLLPLPLVGEQHSQLADIESVLPHRRAFQAMAPCAYPLKKQNGLGMIAGEQTP